MRRVLLWMVALGAAAPTGLSLVGSSGCDGGAEAPCVDLELLKGWAAPPGNVTVYFTVDTCAGEPVPGLVPDDFDISEDGLTVPPAQGNQTILNASIGFRVRTVLVLGLSGSVLESRPELLAAARTFVERTVADDREVAVYVFDGAPTMQRIVDFTADATVLRDGIDSLSTWEPRDLSTDLHGAILEGLGVLDAAAPIPISLDAVRAGGMVLFTDGTDRAARHTQEEAQAAVDSTRHFVMTIGLGGAIDRAGLERFGKDGSEFAAGAEALGTAFERTADRVRRMSGRYYVLGYCSPSRSGAHTMELRVEGRRGELRFRFDAAGFGGLCDPNPTGADAGADAGGDGDAGGT